MSDIEKYTWMGDTWIVTKKECEKCGSELHTNQRIYQCIDCDWWKVVGNE